jgi:hypothetical protein
LREKEVQARHVALMRRKRFAQRILVGTPERKRLYRRAWRRWKGNIKMDLIEIGYECMQRTDLAQVRCKWPAL